MPWLQTILHAQLAPSRCFSCSGTGIPAQAGKALCKADDLMNHGQAAICDSDGALGFEPAAIGLSIDGSGRGELHQSQDSAGLGIWQGVCEGRHVGVPGSNDMEPRRVHEGKHVTAVQQVQSH